jgi:hypothetical protein
VVFFIEVTFLPMQAIAEGMLMFVIIDLNKFPGSYPLSSS